MRLFLLFVGLAFVFGACEDFIEYRPEARGREGEILVVTDTLTWTGPAGEALREVLGSEIQTLPVPEPLFKLKREALTNAFIEQLKQQKNLIFLASIDDTTAAARFLRARIPEEGQQSIREGRGQGIVDRPDLWVNRQLVVYATAKDDEALADAILERGPVLRRLFTETTTTRTREDMFEKARQTAKEDSILQKHDFAINVQHDYFFAQDTVFADAEANPVADESGGLVRLRRIPESTWRDLFVYYQDGADPSQLTPEYAKELQNQLTQQFIKGTYPDSYIKISEARPPEVREVDLNGRYAIELRGLWGMTNDALGGPFVSYLTYDEDQQRLYLYSGFVFAPNYAKREFIRQMEIIGNTFRTASDPAAAPSASR